MTIDEISKGLEKASDYLLNAVGGYPLSKAEEKMINSIDYTIEFIEWYRSQDLIPRETAKMIVKHETGFCSPLGLETLLNSIEEHLEWIPKAEPPKE